jgi:hypothetical protein
MQNLVIGNTSQLAQYFPQNYIKISSRNIDEGYLKNKNWDSVHICFAEQRTFLANDDKFKNVFFDTNVHLVKKIISNLNAKKIFYYSTAELWNNLSGPISLNIPFNFIMNNYTNSKYEITEELKNKNKYPNVSIVYPFNFNSVYRKQGYLFSKIFDSILNKTKIEIGDTHYYRDIIHPKIIIDSVLKHDIIEKDIIIGSGYLTNVNDFIQNLYKKMNLNYYDYVIEKIDRPSPYRKNIFYSSVKINNYDKDFVLNQTVKELNEKYEYCN